MCTGDQPPGFDENPTGHFLRGTRARVPRMHDQKWGGTMAGLAETMVCGVVRAESYERAKKFYSEVLGLKQAQEFPGPGGGGMFEASGGTMLMVYENPSLKAPENTTLGFGVSADRFDAIMADLRSKGVVFEDYDLSLIHISEP